MATKRCSLREGTSKAKRGQTVAERITSDPGWKQLDREGPRSSSLGCISSPVKRAGRASFGNENTRTVLKLGQRLNQICRGKLFGKLTKDERLRRRTRCYPARDKTSSNRREKLSYLLVGS